MSTARDEAGFGKDPYFRPNTARNARWQFVGVMTGITAKRHYDITGDWELSLRAAGRALVRWTIFFIVGICFNLLAAATLALAVIPWVNMQTHRPLDQAESLQVADGLAGVMSQEQVLRNVTSIACLVVFYLLSVPYTMGVLWMRNSDRSLFKVNHLRIYRWIMPFTVRMRRLPDWALYVLHIPLLLAAWWIGQGIGILLAGIAY